MKQIEELKGLMIDSLEELREERIERRDLFDSLDMSTRIDIYTDTDERGLQLLQEMVLIDKEMARLTLEPVTPTMFDMVDSSGWDAFEKGRQFDRDKRSEKAAHAQHKKTRQSIVFAAKRASDLLKKDETIRRGEIARDIARKLEITNPAEKDIRRIKSWLVKAEENGLLTIPSEASNPGAGKTPKK